jgi:hypothetical protein
MERKARSGGKKGGEVSWGELLLTVGEHPLCRWEEPKVS